MHVKETRAAFRPCFAFLPFHCCAPAKYRASLCLLRQVRGVALCLRVVSQYATLSEVEMEYPKALALRLDHPRQAELPAGPGWLAQNARRQAPRPCLAQHPPREAKLLCP